MIRNWLGIAEIERTIAEKEVKLRRLVGEAVEATLEGKPDNKWWPHICSVHHKNTLQYALEKASLKTASSAAKAEVENRISNEAFIDEIVVRIQRKQLKV